MLEKFAPTPEDPIIKTIELFRKDPREHKIDVGVGVFKDHRGHTPIMAAVRKAEQLLHDEQTTKTYVGLAGDEQFNDSIASLVFGDSESRSRVRAVQAPGGCGALSVLTTMLSEIARDHTVWISDPTWGNHYPLIQHGGFEIRAYPYFDPETKAVRDEALLDTLKTMGSSDIVFLHGCCHNPTGAELSHAMWDEIAAICAKNGIFPFVDLAYQGFGDSLKADVYGVRTLAARVESMVVASSCSKNFGIYRDRVGCAMLLANSEAVADIARGHILTAARSSYSMPPDHGAAIVARILNDTDLRSEWESELTEMRNRILGLRRQLSDVLRRKSGTDRWDFIADHRGMFSTLVLDQQQTDTMMEQHAVYTVAGGRINIAGFKDDRQIERFADVLIEVTS